MAIRESFNTRSVSMNILSVTQGSDAWLETRKSYFTASEASPAHGKSKYLSRSDLLKQKYLGISPDVNARTQSLFDKGHAAEESARRIAENIIGQDLFPVTATLGIDGLPL